MTRSLLVLSRLLILALPGAMSAQATWRISSTPLASVAGAPDGFAEVIDARLMDNGGFVVVDRREGRLHFFDRSGRSIRSAGGLGAGPGEFRGLIWIQVLPGDSVVAYDWQQRRFALFDAGGRHVRSWGYSPPQGVSNAAPRAILANGGMLLTIRRGVTFPFPGKEGEVRADSLELLALTTTGQLAWRGRVFKGGSVFGFAYNRAGERYLAGVELPFGANMEFGILPRGVVVSEGERSRLMMLGSDGRTSELAVTLPAPAPISPAMRAALVERFTGCDRGTGNDVEPTLGAAMSTMRTPTMLAAIGRLLVDPQGGIWVSQGASAGYPAVCGLPLPDQRRWSLLTATGGIAATVELPTAMRVTDIGVDRLLGLVVDADDVVHVVSYGLTRP